MSSDNFSDVGSGVTCKVVGSVAVGCGFAGKFSGSEEVALRATCEVAGLFALACGVASIPTAWIRSSSANSHASIAKEISARSFIPKEPFDADSIIWIVFSSFSFSKQLIWLADNPVLSKVESSRTWHSIRSGRCPGILDKSKTSPESSTCKASNTSVRFIGPSLFAAHSMALMPPNSLKPKKDSLFETFSRS